MKRNFLGFLLLLIATIGLAATDKQNETKVVVLECTPSIVTLSCGAEYEGCFESWVEYWHSYVVMNARYCDDEMEPPPAP